VANAGTHTSFAAAGSSTTAACTATHVCNTPLLTQHTYVKVPRNNNSTAHLQAQVSCSHSGQGQTSSVKGNESKVCKGCNHCTYRWVQATGLLRGMPRCIGVQAFQLLCYTVPKLEREYQAGHTKQ
jgi:hypothetical protein